MRFAFFILIFVLPRLYFSQQDNWTVAVRSVVEIRTWKLTTKAEEEINPLSGAQITAMQNGKVVATSISDVDGKFVINIPPNGSFVVEVSFPGLISKRFSVNSTGVPDELRKEENFKPSFGIGGFILSKPFKGIDYSGLSTPLVHVIYDNKVKNFDDDETCTERGLEIAGRIFDSEQTLVTNFCNLNKQGDQALKKPDCPLAKMLYEKAMGLIPGEPYPAEQMKKVGECLKENELAEKRAKDAVAAKQRADSLARAVEKEKQIQREKEKELKLAKEKREKEITDSLKSEKEKQLTLKAEADKKQQIEAALKKQKADSAQKIADQEKLLQREKDKSVKEKRQREIADSLKFINEKKIALKAEEEKKKKNQDALSKLKADSLVKALEKEKQIQIEKEKELKLSKEKRQKEISDSLKTAKEKHLALKTAEEKKRQAQEFKLKNIEDSLARVSEKQKSDQRAEEKSRQIAVAKRNKEIADSIRKADENKAQSEKQKSDSLQKAIANEKRALKEKESLALLQRQKREKQLQDSLSKVKVSKENSRNQLVVEEKNKSKYFKKDSVKNEKSNSEDNGIIIKKVSNNENDISVKSGDKKGKVRAGLGDDQYRSEISKGDRFYRIKKWVEASFHYENALRMKPEDEYAKKKLEEINSILKPKKSP